MDDERLGGRFLLLDRHATGGMATVWRARDEWTGEIVAIKRLHPHVVADPAARARLEREADALRALDHPAIVRPRELLDDPADPALVMDFVAGQPLSERIGEGPLPAEEAVAIAGIVADALSAAHDRGIVHRDIKPANILVDDDGAVHLVDFGIVALTDAPPDGLTAESTMVGTLRYAAPERLAGGEASARSDVWALGAVLFEMLTGRAAVAAADPAAALAASLAAPGDLDGLSPYLASVVATAMAPDPADRYPDAIALRDALAADGAPIDPDALTAVVPIPVMASEALPALAGFVPVAATAEVRPAPQPVRIPQRATGLILAGLVAAAAVFAVAASDLMSGSRGSGADAVGIPGSSAPAAPRATATARPSPSAAPTTTKPKPGKGNGNGKGSDKHD